jgi:hypothetical protein
MTKREKLAKMLAEAERAAREAIGAGYAPTLASKLCGRVEGLRKALELLDEEHDKRRRARLPVGGVCTAAIHGEQCLCRGKS